nr:hypothetical protein [Sediminibacterium sp.]
LLLQKDGGGCYLFNCLEPNVCLFSQNNEFSTVQLDRSSQHLTTSTAETVPKFKHGNCKAVFI